MSWTKRFFMGLVILLWVPPAVMALLVLIAVMRPPLADRPAPDAPGIVVTAQPETINYVALHRGYADSLLAALGPMKLGQLPDSTFTRLQNYGTLHRDRINLEAARRAARARQQTTGRRRCMLADGSAAPGFQLLYMNLWEGQKLGRASFVSRLRRYHRGRAAGAHRGGLAAMGASASLDHAREVAGRHGLTL